MKDQAIAIGTSAHRLEPAADHYPQFVEIEDRLNGLAGRLQGIDSHLIQTNLQLFGTTVSPKEDSADKVKEPEGNLERLLFAVNLCIKHSENIEEGLTRISREL